MKKHIIKQVLSVLMIISMLFNTTAISLGKTADEDASIIFKYYDLNAGEFIPDGTNLVLNRDYELHVFLKDIKEMTAFTLPFHFNSDVIKIVSYETNDIVSDGSFNSKSFKKGTNGVIWNKDFFDEDDGIWAGGSIAENNLTPYLNNSTGYLTLTFYNDTDKESLQDIVGEQLLLKIKFRTVNTGKVDFRAAIKNDGQEGVDYDGTAPNGFVFSKYDGTVISHNEIFDRNKRVFAPVTGIDILESSVSLGVSQTHQLEAVVYPSDADQTVVWESSDEDVVTVDSEGNITGVKIGKAIITAYATDKNFSDTCEVEIIDVAVPSVPKNLKTEYVSGSRAIFSWGESSGYYGVDGYIIYRDGVEIARVGNDVLSYEDTDNGIGLTTGREYRYTVAAYYKDSVSTQSESLLITPKGVNITSVTPENSQIGGDGKVKFTVYYDDTHNAQGAKVYMSGGKTSQEAQPYEIENIKTGVSGKSNYFSFEFDMSTITESGDYKFIFTVEDADGFNDSYEANYNVDVTPPSKITGFTAEGYQEYNMLSWDKSVEANAEKYLIYRSTTEDGPYSLITTVNNRDKVTYKDTDVNPGTTYYYYVVAQDIYGQQSEKSDIKSAMPLNDTTPPEVLFVKVTPNRDVLTGVVTVEFTVHDDVSLDKIEFEYLNNEGVFVKHAEQKLASDKARFQFDTTKFDDGKITIRAIVYDGSGNVSNGKPEKSYIIDNTGPSKPKNLAALNVLSTSFYLMWDDVTDEDRDYYVVEYRRAGTNEAFKTINYVKTVVTDVVSLSPNTEYEFYVTAYDKYGNRGETSDVLYVTTSKDEEAPKIISITPASKKISEDIDVYFTATDDSGVDYAEIQVSFNNGETWEKINEVDITSNSAKATFKHTLKISEYDEGAISIRAIPVDTSGNRGISSSNALYNSYYIDRTPVDVPENVVANPFKDEDGDAIEIRWDSIDFEKEKNEDFLCYIVYRSESENGTYEIINSNCTDVTYIDHEVDSNKTYYYKVKSSDECGNLSEFSNVASALVKDTEKPEFYGIYPENNGYIGSNMTITANVIDNCKLSYVELYYLDSSKNWVKLERKNASSSSMTAKFVLDGNMFGEGTYKFKVVASDTADNSATSEELTYHIDRTPPAISNLEATAGEKSVTLTWDCDDTSDLSGYYVYYKTEGGYYSSKSNATVSAKDKTVTIHGLDPNYKYQFKLVAFDYAGNKSQLESKLVSPLPGEDTEEEKDTTPPVIMMNIPSVLMPGEEGTFDASGSYDNVKIKSYKWEFGDGSVSDYKTAAHSYSKVGVYNVKLTITDTSGNVKYQVKQVTVKEKIDVATVKIKVRDDSNKIIPNTNVIFDYGKEEEARYTSNSSGVVEVKTQAGTHSVAVYKEGYTSAEKSVNAINNDTTELLVTLVKKDIYIVSLQWKEMTAKEKQKANIKTPGDTYSYDIKLVIGGEEITASGHKTVNNPEDNLTPIEIKTSIPVNSGGKSMNQKIYIYDFNDKKDFIYDNSNPDNPSPKTIIAALSTPGGVLWVGESIDVGLTISNQAEKDFVINNCRVILDDSQDGLELRGDLSNAQSNTYVDLGSIAGDETKTVNWVLRGKLEGEYPILVDFKGVPSGFDTEINNTFESEKPIKIYGDSEMTIVVESENRTNIYDDYSFRVGIRNGSREKLEPPEISIEEDGYINSVNDYQNYIEKNGHILRVGTDALYPRETLYSDYTFNTEQHTIEAVQQKLREKFGNIYADLPVYYRVVPQYSFNKSFLTILSDNEKLPATIKLHKNEEKTVTLNVSRLNPKTSQYVNCDGEKIYVKQDGGEYSLLGTTKKDGCIDYTFKVPETHDGENYRISIRANRTGEEHIDIFVLNDENKVCLEGIVTDQYGNPVSKASVEAAGKQTSTDRSGKYKLEGLDRGKTRIIIKKDGYESVDKNLVLNNGHIIKNYKMKQTPKHKPKIISISSNIADDATDEIIVPMGLDMDYVLDIKAKVPGGGEVDGYFIEHTKADGSLGDGSKSSTSVVSYNFSSMGVGDSLNVYVTSGDAQSPKINIPVKIVETPFVGIFNASDSKSNEKIINECYSFKLPVSKLFDETWLTGDFKDYWEALYQKFKVTIESDEENDNDGIISKTKFDINWFDYMDYEVTAKYDFTNGDFKIFSGYITERGREVYENNSHSRFDVEEFINEDIEEKSSNKHAWLEPWNSLSWYIDGGFNVEFKLDSKDDADTWKGSFNLWSDDSKDFYGTYHRKANSREHTKKASNKEYHEGVWNKNFDVHQNEVIELSKEGIENSKFVMDYTTYTQGSRKNGITNTIYSSEIKKEIYLLPEMKIVEKTSTAGNYGVLGYSYDLYEKSKKPNDDEGSVELMESSLAGIKNEEFAPVVMINNPQKSDNNGFIANNIFLNTQNALSDGDSKILVYLNNNEKRKIEGERSQVVYISYNEGNWSDETAIVSDDETGDYTPHIKDTPYGMMCAWADSTGYLDDKKDKSIEEISNDVASKLSISLAVYDSDNNVWSEPQAWSDSIIGEKDNNYLDYAPVIASQKSDENPLVMVCWIANKDNNMTDANRRDEIMFTIFDGTSWTEPESIFGDTLGAVSDLKLEEHNGVFHVLFSMQTVDDGEDSEDTSDDTIGESKLQTAMYSNGRWSVNRAINAKEEADEFSDFIFDNDELQVVYTNSMYVNRVDALTREEREEHTENSLINTASEMISVQNDDFTALAWISNPADTQKIYLNTLNDGTWSENIEVVSAKPNEVITNLKAFIDDNKVVVVYNKYVYGTVDDKYTLIDVELCSESVDIVPDISVENLEVDDISVMKDKEVHFTVKVKNNGIKNIESYTVCLEGEAFDNPIENVINEPLKGGEEKIINIDWIATEITNSFEVVAKVVTGNVTSQKEASIVLTPYDIEITEVTLEDTGDELTAIIKLENNGYYNIDKYQVIIKCEAIKDDMGNEQEIKIESNGEILCGETQTVNIDLTDHIEELSEANTRLGFSVSTGLVEFNEDNNFIEKSIQTNIKDHSSWSGVLDFVDYGDESLDKKYFADTLISVEVVEDEAAAVEANENGAFTIQAPTSEENYNVTISRKGVLERTMENVKFSDTAAISDSAIELIPGDIVQDSTNSINPTDIARMIYLIGNTSDKPIFDECADFDSSGANQTNDLYILLSNAGKNSSYYTKLSTSDKVLE